MQRILFVMAGLLASSPAFAEIQGQSAQSWTNSWLVQTGNAAGAYGVGNPLNTADASNAAFHGARVLTPSGTAGQAGTISGSPYPSTAGGATASSSNTGYSFSWDCSTAGVGSITTADGSVLPYSFFSNSGGIGRDGYAIIDAEPGSAAGCVFAVLR